MEYVCDDFKKDHELVLKAVTSDGYVLQYADRAIFKDKKIILKSLETSSLSNIIELIDKNLLNDRDIALAAVKLNGGDLEYIDKSLRKDEEIISIAIKNSSFAFEHIDESFKKNIKFLLSIINEENFTIIQSHLDQSVYSNKDFIFNTMNIN